MQLHTIVFTTALAVTVTFAPSASAAECTKDQLAEMSKLLGEDAALAKACPDNSGGSGAFNFEKNDPKAWAKVSPCKDASCVTYLKDQITKLPTCEVDQVNMKDVYEDKLTLCIDLASGNLTAAEITKRIGNVSYDEAGSGMGTGSGMPGTVKASSGNSSTPVPTPTPTTKKSGTPTVVVTGGALSVAALAVLLAV